MNKNRIFIAAAVFGAICVPLVVVAAEKLTIKWTQDVGAIVKIVSVEAGEPIDKLRTVNLTYEAVRSCGSLAVYGHSYSKDDVQLGLFSVTSGRSNAVLGQKFRDQTVVAFEPGHYLVLDKVYCLNK